MMYTKFKKFAAAAITAIYILGLLTSCSRRNPELVSKTEILLDTSCRITVYDNVSGEVIDKAFERIKEIDTKMNASSNDSELSAINKAAGKSYVKVSEDTFYVITQSIKYGNLTGGKFDVTVGPLVKMWGINTENARVPAKDEIKAALPLIDYRNILVKGDTKEVMLKKVGMSLDLGGIAKGYAGDAAAEVLKNNGVKHAIIDLGGNIVTLGSKVDGSEWKIGIQNPNVERGSYLGTVNVAGKVVITSGIYERYFIKDGVRYHHILDTTTGYPVNNELASVTVICDKSTDGDALSKVFCFGVNKGLEFIQEQKNVEAIFVTKDNKVYMTPGLKDNFRITDNSFKLIN